MVELGRYQLQLRILLRFIGHLFQVPQLEVKEVQLLCLNIVHLGLYQFEFMYLLQHLLYFFFLYQLLLITLPRRIHSLWAQVPLLLLLISCRRLL